MDINMPLMNGFECLTQLKKQIRLRNIPVVILTTSNNLVEVERASVLGANFFLRKPSLFSLIKMNLISLLNFYFPQIIDKQKNRDDPKDPAFPADMEPHIIALSDGLS